MTELEILNVTRLLKSSEVDGGGTKFGGDTELVWDGEGGIVRWQNIDERDTSYRKFLTFCM